MKIIKTFVGLLLILTVFNCDADNNPPRNIDELLKAVKQLAVEDAALNKAREREFIQKQRQQEQLLQQAKADLMAQQKLSDTLQTRFDNNEKKLIELDQLLHKRMGSLGETIGVVRQVAGDTAGIFENSLVSVQIKDRLPFIKELSKEQDLPSIDQLQNLWYALQEEITESGKVVKFQRDVIRADGREQSASVVRIGVFNVISEGTFLRYISETDQLVELARQPPSRFRNMAAKLENASSGRGEMVVDPSRGTLLAMQVQSPDLLARILQGKLVGYIIITLAFIGIIMIAERFYSLTIAERKIEKTLSNSLQNSDNALGRVLSVYSKHRDSDIETLERRIDEAILKEIPQLERGISIIKILAVISPLLGLLGTVTGMIETFQSITLFGTGDPKLMAGGISQALVTTMLGLMAAIPLILFHSIVSGKSKRCVSILEEQSAGIIATHAEQARA